MIHTLHGTTVVLACWIVTADLCSTSLWANCKMAPPPTLCERLDAADVVYHAELVPLADQKTGWKILETLKAGAPAYRAGEMPGLQLWSDDQQLRKPPGNYAIFGTSMKPNEAVHWSAVKITPEAALYLRAAPRGDPLQPEATRRERLRYFLNHLEYEDDLIADDAASEIGVHAFDDLATMIDELPRKKLRGWLQAAQTKADRIGKYGLLLGLCGTTEDAEILKAIILRPTDQFRNYLDLLMFGYLLLTGEPGLALIEESKINDPKAAFSETYHAMGAIRLMWRHGQGPIEAKRLRHSMRLLLEKPELADLVIDSLARMEDWDMQDRLMEMYGTGEYDIPAIKRAIVRYLMACAESPELPAAGHVQTAKRNLALLAERDPKTVNDAKRFWKKRRN
jgi:hypothetical protein